MENHADYVGTNESNNKGRADELECEDSSRDSPPRPKSRKLAGPLLTRHSLSRFGERNFHSFLQCRMTPIGNASHLTCDSCVDFAAIFVTRKLNATIWGSKMLKSTVKHRAIYSKPKLYLLKPIALRQSAITVSRSEEKN